MPIALEVLQVMVLVLAKEKHLKLSGNTFFKKSLIFFTKALVITEEIRALISLPLGFGFNKLSLFRIT